MQLRYYIGTSGWYYEHWQDRFYPRNLSKTKWLEFYASNFNSIELNNSFYRLPSEKAFASWHNSTPADFKFAVKVSRFITHVKRLKDTDEAENKLVTRARILEPKLGPLLYQLPPNIPRNDERLESFLSTLPPGMKHIFEFRHPSWLDEGIFAILRRFNAGFCFFDMPSVSCPLVATADFAYVQFHGNASLYGSSYSDGKLADWAKKLAHLATKLREIYIYFNNDAEAFAIKNAQTLSHILEARSNE